MSTELETPYIPDDSEVETPGGGSKSWRLANGKFVRGEETPAKSGNYPDERTSLTGLIKRVGIQDGSYQKDTASGGKVTRPIYRLEVDIQTNKGIETIAWSLLDSKDDILPKTGTIRLAWALTQFDGSVNLEVAGKSFQLTPMTLVKLESWRGEDWEDPKTGQPRTGSTYVSVYACSPILDAEGTPTGKYNPVKLQKPKVENKAPATEQWNEIVPDLRKLPFYKEREMKSGGAIAQTHLAGLCKECEAKGWPTPEQDPATWLATAAVALQLPSTPSTLSGISDDDWGALKLNLSDRAELPEFLRASAEKLGLIKPVNSGALA